MDPLRIAAACVMWGAPSMGLACAAVPPPGGWVEVETEEAIIIWDAAAKTQHFIRRASFDAKAKDFGFLVPTPTQPVLAEADDGAFAHLRQLTYPMVSVAAAAEKARLAPASAVTVLERKKVAGLDAAVLEATRAEALDGWLKKNGYRSSPELVDWYRPYVEKRWKITAFKIDTQGAPRTSSAAVRMSFETPQPFFPYREPQRRDVGGKKPQERLLTVYLIADARFDARGWPGDTVWANRIETKDRERLFELLKLPQETARGAAWLTELVDRSQTRDGKDDMFFARSSSQTPTDRSQTPIRSSVIWIWLVGGLILAAALGYQAWVLIRSRRSGAR